MPEFLILKSPTLLAEQKQKKWHLRGVVAKCDHKGLNERWYPRHEMEKAIRQAGLQILGTLDHEPQVSLSLDKAAVVVRKLEIVEDCVVAEMEVLNTTAGKNLAGLLDAGIRVGVSTRGTGDVGEDGRVSNFRISSFDIVSKPANTGGAMMDAILEAVMDRELTETEKKRLRRVLSFHGGVDVNPTDKEKEGKNPVSSTASRTLDSVVSAYRRMKTEGQMRLTKGSRFVDPKDDNKSDSHHKNPFPNKRKPLHTPPSGSKVKLEHSDFLKTTQLLEAALHHPNAEDRFVNEEAFHESMNTAAKFYRQSRVGVVGNKKPYSPAHDAGDRQWRTGQTFRGVDLYKGFRGLAHDWSRAKQTAMKAVAAGNKMKKGMSGIGVRIEGVVSDSFIEACAKVAANRTRPLDPYWRLLNEAAPKGNLHPDWSQLTDVYINLPPSDGSIVSGASGDKARPHGHVNQPHTVQPGWFDVFLNDGGAESAEVDMEMMATIFNYCAKKLGYNTAE